MKLCAGGAKTRPKLDFLIAFKSIYPLNSIMRNLCSFPYCTEDVLWPSDLRAQEK